MRKITGINVWIADGKVSPTVGQGMVCVPDLVLRSVPHVPKLTYNLLSVSKLTKDINCKMTLCLSHCEFQDLSSGKMIGSAEEKDDLYYLSITGDSSRCQSPNSLSLSVMSSSDVRLWHKRLSSKFFLSESIVPSFVYQ